VKVDGSQTAAEFSTAMGRDKGVAAGEVDSHLVQVATMCDVDMWIWLDALRVADLVRSWYLLEHGTCAWKKMMVVAAFHRREGWRGVAMAAGAWRRRLNYGGWTWCKRRSPVMLVGREKIRVRVSCVRWKRWSHGTPWLVHMHVQGLMPHGLFWLANFESWGLPHGNIWLSGV